MGGPQAAGVLATVRRDNIEAEGKTWSAEEEAAFKKPVLENFEREGHPYFATARLWDDGIIAPSETRRVVALALSRRAQRADPAAAVRGVSDVIGLVMVGLVPTIQRSITLRRKLMAGSSGQARG